MGKITKPQQSSKNTGHQITGERALERRERQEGTFGINGRKLRHSSDQTTAFSCPPEHHTCSRGEHREQSWPGAQAKGGSGWHGRELIPNHQGFPPFHHSQTPSSPFLLHSLPLRGKPQPNIPLPAPSHNDSPFRKQLLSVWNIMCLLPLQVFLESLGKISSAAQLCQKRGKKKKIPALSLQAANGIFAKIGSI